MHSREQNELAELVVIFSIFTQWQVKMGLFSSEVAVFREYIFSFSLAVSIGAVCKSHLHGGKPASY